MSSPIVISILTNANQANAQLERTATTGQKIGSGFRRAAVPAAAALGLLAAGAKVATDAAAEDARAQTVLATALKNSTGATKGQVAATEAWIDKTARATGVADDQLRPALANLVRSTGSVEKSQKALGLAMDISAATGKDVGSVSAALSKGYAGNTTALGRLVPGIDKAVLKSGDMNKITAELARTTGGTMAKAADTEAGKMARAQVARDEAVETIGARLLPVYAAMASALATAANWAAKHERTVVILGTALGVLAGFVLVVNAAMKVYTATQLVLNAVLAANPIGIVIIALVALGAALAVAWAKSDTFRAIVTGAWNKVRSAAASVGSFIASNWKRIAAIVLVAAGPIGVAAVAIIRNWNKIKSAATGLVGGVRTAFTAVVTFVKGIPGKIKGAFSGAGSLLSSVGRNIIEGLIGGIKDKAGAAVDAAKGVVKGAVDGAKRLLGIKSPSRVFRVIGQQTMAGLEDGIDARRRNVLRTVAKVARDVSATPMALGLTDAKGKPSMAGVDAYAGTTTINNHYWTVEVPLGSTRAEVGRELKRLIAAAEGRGL